MAYQNLVKMQEASCQKYYERPLLGTMNRGDYEWVTYGQFASMVDSFRGSLAKLGISHGDRIAIISGNSLEWAVAAYATYGLGGVFVPMYEKQAVSECEFIIQDCGAKIVLCSTPEVHEALANIKSSCLELIIPTYANQDTENSFAALVEAGKQIPTPSLNPRKDDAQGIIYTSGTTGNPKGVVLTHGNIIVNITEVANSFPFSQNDRLLSFLPWAHIFAQAGELHGAMRLGFSVALNKNVADLSQDLELAKPTVIMAVPRIFQKIYDGILQKMAAKGGPIEFLFKSGLEGAQKKREGQPIGLIKEAKLLLAQKVIFKKITDKFGGNLRFCISGAAALSKEINEFMTNLGIPVYEGYGLSETSPIISCNRPGKQRIGSVGQPASYAKVILDHSVSGATDNEGEIVAYGPMVMQGYLNRQEDTDLVIGKDGGFRTGDLGRFDDEGFLYITGRIKEQYKLQNGKYIVPTVLEEKLKASPLISQVLVSGANKNFNVALVVPEKETLLTLSREKSWGDDIRELVNNHDVKQHFNSIIENLQSEFKGYEKVRDFKLLHEEWNPDNGMLTQTLKVKRRIVLEKHGLDIEKLYS